MSPLRLAKDALSRVFIFPLIGVFFSSPPSVRAQQLRQLVSFETSASDAPGIRAGAVVPLARFASGEALNRPLSIQVNAREASGASRQISCLFPAGSTRAECVVDAPLPVAPGADRILSLQIVESEAVQAFSKKRHLLRTPRSAQASAGSTIRAVIFSGAENPLNAVECLGAQSVVEGGILALGGGSPVPAADLPARLIPHPSYATGEWVPPLSPRLLEIRFTSVRSEAAR